MIRRPSPFGGITFGIHPMQDLLWLALVGGLFAATIAYVRLCDEA
ncbi:hypothetical protein [Sphingomonas cannabina]|nr:hypothetical protein [Sphingomonas cannabina]